MFFPRIMADSRRSAKAAVISQNIPKVTAASAKRLQKSLRTLSGKFDSQTVNIIINNTNNFKSRRTVNEDAVTGRFIRFARSAAH